MGTTEVSSYTLEVEFPAIFLDDNWQPAWEDVGRRTKTHRFFRMTHEIFLENPLKQTIYGGDTRHLLTIPYQVDEKNDRPEALESSIWITVYSEGERVRSVQKAVADFQNNLTN